MSFSLSLSLSLFPPPPLILFMCRGWWGCRIEMLGGMTDHRYPFSATIFNIYFQVKLNNNGIAIICWGSCKINVSFCFLYLILLPFSPPTSISEHLSCSSRVIYILFHKNSIVVIVLY